MTYGVNNLAVADLIGPRFVFSQSINSTLSLSLFHLPSPSHPITMLGSDKHFLNSPSTLVVDSLKGLCAANPSLKLDEANKGYYFVAYPDCPTRVSLI